MEKIFPWYGYATMLDCGDGVVRVMSSFSVSSVQSNFFCTLRESHTCCFFGHSSVKSSVVDCMAQRCPMDRYLRLIFGIFVASLINVLLVVVAYSFHYVLMYLMVLNGTYTASDILILFYKPTPDLYFSRTFPQELFGLHGASCLKPSHTTVLRESLIVGVSDVPVSCPNKQPIKFLPTQ